MICPSRVLRLSWSQGWRSPRPDARGQLPRRLELSVGPGGAGSVLCCALCAGGSVVSPDLGLPHKLSDYRGDTAWQEDPRSHAGKKSVLEGLLLFYFILGCWRRKRLAREPPSCILLGGRSRFWREDRQDGWEGSSLKPCDCPGRCGLLQATLLMINTGRRGPACFDGGRCHQALHLFSWSLGSQRLDPPGIIGGDDEIWICLPLQTFSGIHWARRRCHWARSTYLL